MFNAKISYVKWVCGNCKGTHVREETKAGEISVYIGDGHSDICGVREADITFAKDTLADWCRDKDFFYHPFNDFSHVLEGIQHFIHNGD